MKAALIPGLVFGGLLVATFWLGRSSASGAEHLPLLEAQGSEGRGPQPPGATPPIGTKAAPPLVWGGDSGGSSSSNGILAVTGSYGVGTSVLYVLDTNTKQLAVYEARGGSAGSRKLFLVGARRIDLDLQLVGYNDDSEAEVHYDQLQRRFGDLRRAAGRADAKDPAHDPATVPPTKGDGKTEPGREK